MLSIVTIEKFQQFFLSIGGSRISKTGERGIDRLRVGRQTMLEGEGIPGVSLDPPLLLFLVHLFLTVVSSFDLHSILKSYHFKSKHFSILSKITVSVFQVGQQNYDCPGTWLCSQSNTRVFPDSSVTPSAGGRGEARGLWAMDFAAVHIQTNTLYEMRESRLLFLLISS